MPSQSIFVLLVSAAAAATAGALASPPRPHERQQQQQLPPLQPAAVACAVDAAGAFSLSVDGASFFASGATFFRAGGQLFSTADGSLAVAAPPSPPTAGSDAMGAFMRQEVQWRAAGAPAGTVFATAVQVYAAAGAVVFEQSWPGGAAGTAAPGGDADSVLSAWPSFALDGAGNASGRAAVSFGGRFLEASRAFMWSDVARNGMSSVGQHGGPVTVFDKAYTSSVSIMSLTQHAVQISQVVAASGGGGGGGGGGGAAAALAYGLLGSVTSIPAGFVARTLVAATRGGPSAGTLRAGRLALQYHGTTRARDLTNEVLGYATDNGQYYYYMTEKNASSGKPLTYEQTLLDVVADAKAREIPYKYMQLDSWWYTQGKGGGVVNWDAKPEVFPHGLEWFSQQVQMPFYMHNRMWAAENVYATQNGGAYDFIVETSNNLAIPTTQAFWDDFLRNASTKWGMIVYEQDWMYNEAEGLNSTRESATLTGQWLTQMATAAAKVNATVQYCMSLGRLVTMAVELPALTQFRAGDDYGPGQPAGCSFPYCVYYIGTTSLLGWALDIAPSKDAFWSNEIQPGSPFGHGNATEPYAAMEAAIAVMSTAPVQLGDGIGFTNVTLALATCTSGGRLLQPSRPASAIDACFAADAFADGASGPVAARDHVLPVMSTHTLVGARAWAHILVIALAAPFQLAPADLPLDTALDAGDAGSWVAYSGWRKFGGGAFGALADFSGAAPLALASAPDPMDWTLLHAAPLFSNGWALLGEPSKLVPVSALRVAGVVAPAGGGVSASVRGEPGEVVALVFAQRGAGGAYSQFGASCAVGGAGVATISVDAQGAAHCA